MDQKVVEVRCRSVAVSCTSSADWGSGSLQSARNIPHFGDVGKGVKVYVVLHQRCQSW